MSDHHLTSRRRHHEERHFQEIERQLVEKLRKLAEENARRRALSDETGVTDPDILTDLQALGYTPETLSLLFLEPLIQVAWADGHVSEREEQMILDIALARGITAESERGRRLRDWLTHRPSDADFDKTMRVILAILQARPADDRASAASDLLSFCTAVADISGGLLGIGRISPGEKALLTRIATELELNHREATRKTIAALAQEM